MVIKQYSLTCIIWGLIIPLNIKKAYFSHHLYNHQPCPAEDSQHLLVPSQEQICVCYLGPSVEHNPLVSFLESHITSTQAWSPL